MGKSEQPRSAQPEEKPTVRSQNSTLWKLLKPSRFQALQPRLIQTFPFQPRDPSVKPPLQQRSGSGTWQKSRKLPGREYVGNIFPSKIHVATLNPLPLIFCLSLFSSRPLIPRNPWLCSRKTRTRPALSPTGRLLSLSYV
ncbi:Uncharacterized protein APZ42_034494 [Daphnia magna]|uniref:Uncharacterized protein n=1 Tax=Daphnia magna TaxID=35525 RepID=A0A164K375_9CRUS|nr:Uncharacterized protein APZ42_034494 [Daphnia magna]